MEYNLNLNWTIREGDSVVGEKFTSALQFSLPSPFWWDIENAASLKAICYEKNFFHRITIEEESVLVVNSLDVIDEAPTSFCCSAGGCGFLRNSL